MEEILIVADFMTSEQRKRCMSKVRGKDTAAELYIRKALWHAGFRYRLKSRLPGNPDIILKKHMVAIFIHGCFWHNHEGCSKSKMPATRKEFWANKIARNVQRDKRNISELDKNGWRIAVVWECSIKNKKSKETTISYLTKWISSNSKRFETQV